MFSKKSSSDLEENSASISEKSMADLVRWHMNMLSGKDKSNMPAGHPGGHPAEHPGGHPGGHPAGHPGGHPGGRPGGMTHSHGVSINDFMKVMSKASKAPTSSWQARMTDDPLAHAFAEKVTVHAGMVGTPVEGEHVSARMGEIFSSPRTQRSVLYVHFPYCESQCTYCGFFGGKYSEAAGVAYVAALKKHLEGVAAKQAAQGPAIEAVYFGGGTPTELPPAALRDLLSTVRRLFPLSDDCEVTMEGRIHSLTPEKVEACLEGGANRFSIGVQSFQTDLRRSIGRLDDQDYVCATLEQLASYNKASIVVDLIYGLPGQTLDTWKADLDLICSLPLDGVDLYQLMVFPGSRLARGVKDGSAAPVAQLHEQGAFYRMGADVMQSRGYKRLSICHWGKTEKERNIYNSLSKQRENCLAFGCGAGGMLDGYFYYSNRAPQQYMDAVMNSDDPFACTSLLVAPPRNADAMQFIISQMEMGYLDVTALGTRVNSEDMASIEPLLNNWKEAGLLEEDRVATPGGEQRRIDLTLAGQFWQVNLSQGLVSTLCGVA